MMKELFYKGWRRSIKMKCEKCGHELVMEAAFCEKCGAPNIHEQQHARKMRKFKNDYLWTKSGVDAIADNFPKVAVRLAVIVALLVLNVVALVIGTNAEGINRVLLKCDASLHAEKYAATLDQYIEDENYMAIYPFANRHGIWLSDEEEYNDYQDFIWVCSDYSSAVKEILSIREIDIAELDTQIDFILLSMDAFYDEVEDSKEPQLYNNGYMLSNQKIQNAYERMEIELNLLLQEYCHLTEEETQMFRQCSGTEWEALLKEGMERK